MIEDGAKTRTDAVRLHQMIDVIGYIENDHGTCEQVCEGVERR